MMIETSREDLILNTLGDLISSTIDAHYTTTERRCVMATRIGYLVARHYGIDIEAIPVNVTVGNRVWAEWMADSLERGLHPGQDNLMPDAAWAIAIHERHSGPAKPNQWPGHLVLANDRSLVDLDFRQFNRPHKDIHAPESAIFLFDDEMSQGFWEENRRATWSLTNHGHDLYAVYEHAPTNMAYLEAGDWKRDFEPVVHSLIKQIDLRVMNA